MTEFTNVRSFAAFEYCPLCGEPLEKERVPVGTGEKIEITCPEHDKLVMPHTNLQWPGE